MTIAFAEHTLLRSIALGECLLGVSRERAETSIQVSILFFFFFFTLACADMFWFCLKQSFKGNKIESMAS